jgi:hypothetical protein
VNYKIVVRIIADYTIFVKINHINTKALVRLLAMFVAKVGNVITHISENSKENLAIPQGYQFPFWSGKSNELTI